MCHPLLDQSSASSADQGKEEVRQHSRYRVQLPSDWSSNSGGDPNPTTWPLSSPRPPPGRQTKFLVRVLPRRGEIFTPDSSPHWIPSRLEVPHPPHPAGAFSALHVAGGEKSPQTPKVEKSTPVSWKRRRLEVGGSRNEKFEIRFLSVASNIAPARQEESMIARSILHPT